MNEKIQYHVVGSQDEYEDHRHVLVGVFDTKEKAIAALNAALEHISNGKIHTPEEIEPLLRDEWGLYQTMREACNGYNPADFRIEEIPLNELVYKTETLI